MGGGDCRKVSPGFKLNVPEHHVESTRVLSLDIQINLPFIFCCHLVADFKKRIQ